MSEEIMKRARGIFVAALVFAIPASVSWGADLLTLTSPTFKDNDIWPSKYACADPGPPPRPGENVSPPLAWSNPPANTKSLALIMQDPDGGFGLGSVHWVAYDIPPT